jgi:hypothetical protein
MSAIVTDHRTLRGMEIAGYIQRNGSPGARERHWTGAAVRVCHVRRGERLINAPGYDGAWHFTYKKQDYAIRYFDGCFKPFVVRMGVEAPSFV